MFVVRKAGPDDHDAMHGVWERSVRATHGFLSEEDIVFYSAMVRRVFGLDMDFRVVLEKGGLRGFMALDPVVSPVKVEALFVDPDHFGKGLGKALIEEAMRLHGRLVLDVNEQNPGARAFYRRLGFRETGRSPCDGAGKPYPLIHMKYGGNVPDRRTQTVDPAGRRQGWRFQRQ